MKIKSTNELKNEKINKDSSQRASERYLLFENLNKRMKRERKRKIRNKREKTPFARNVIF